MTFNARRIAASYYMTLEQWLRANILIHKEEAERIGEKYLEILKAKWNASSNNAIPPFFWTSSTNWGTKDSNLWV